MASRVATAAPGVGPVENLRPLEYRETGYKEMMFTTAVHFARGFELNGFAWVTNCWEVNIVPWFGNNVEDYLTRWLSDTRSRWPQARFITQGEFGELWRKHYSNNDKIDYRFEERGSGIGASKDEYEIRWFMNKQFRLAFLRNWRNDEPGMVIDFTRYDRPANEPKDGEKTRRWSLLGDINMKQTRAQDKPVRFRELPVESREAILKRYPDLDRKLVG